MRYIDGADPIIKNYLDRLVDHTDLQEVIVMEEGAAMSRIF